jgi:hypothetical protein
MNSPALPWYRHPWPWLLMAGPAVVVVAGVITTVMAVRSSDGVVSADYYKQGLAINRTLAREARAKVLAVRADVMFNEERSRVRVLARSAGALPEELQLRLVHPTRSGVDLAARLRHAGGGLYESELRVGRGSAWIVTLEDPVAGWRVAGRWRTSDRALSLVAAE